MSTTQSTTKRNIVPETAYNVMMGVAYRIARQDASGDTQGAANDYEQHRKALTPAAVIEFNHMIARAAMMLQAQS